MVKKTEWRTFLRRVEDRMEQGAKDYGDKSVHRPCQDLIEELQQELLDVAGWAAIMHARLERLRAQADKAEGIE